MWTVEVLDEEIFFLAIDRHYERISTETNRNPPHPPRRQRQLKKELNALDDFNVTLEAFLDNREITDPTQILHKAFEPDLGVAIPGIYVLSAGDWQAFFRLDFQTEIAKGIAVRNVHDSIPVSLKITLASIESRFGRP